MMEQDVPQERSTELGDEMSEERFLKDLYLFMKDRGTPIERIPHLGFKQIDMFLMYKTVKELGGYQQVTTQQLWKKVYNILGGNPRSTSAATCTRRHYEKLLLPYECHQTGYRDDLVFRSPRPQKRFHPSSYHDFEQEYPRNDKRPDFRHLPVFPQTSPSMFTEQRPIFSMPSPFFPHGSTPMSNYIALRESTLPHLSLNPSQDLPRTPASYMSVPSMDAQICKRSIKTLRDLANEYRSTAGLEEPLNLSRTENRLETLSDTPSSFSPCSKKPKFLNEASSLYPQRSLSTEEGAEQEEPADETSTGEASVRSGPSPPKPDVIDLTSSSNANPVPRRPSPPSVNLFNRRPHYSEAVTMKSRERDLHKDWVKEESSGAPAPKLVHRSNPLGLPIPESNSNMEIQIPLKLLHELIRRGMISNPGLTANGSAFQDPTKAEAQPEHKFHVRSRSESSESSFTAEEPANLSLKSAFRNPTDPISQDNAMKKLRLFGGNGVPTDSKPQMFSSYQVNHSLKVTLERDAPRPSQPKLVQVPVIKNQESMNHRLHSYSEESPLSLTMKLGRKPEVMATSNTEAKEIPSSPLLLPDHLKFLLANLPYRLERGQTF